MIRKFTAAVLMMSGLVYGDEILLKDGMKIPGTIKQVHKDKIIISTKYTGELIIDLKNVESFHTETPQNVAFENDQKLVAKVKFEDEKASILEEGREPREVKDLVSVWDVDANHPDYVAPVDPWSYSIYLSLTQQDGNTDKDSYSGGAVAKYGTDDRTGKIYGKFDEGSTNGNKTDKEYIFGVDYEELFGESKQHAWYSRASYENDEIEGVDYRMKLATGYGYYFYREDNKQLRLRAGLGYVKEEYDDPSTDGKDSASLDLGFYYMRNLWEGVKWETDVTYTPSFEDFEEYLLDHSSGISMPVSLKEGWATSLKTGVEHEYNSDPAAGREHLDTTYFLRLNIDF